MGFSDHDIKWMRRALVLARRGLGKVEPNPAVGCVIVKGKGEAREVVGEGYHKVFGGAHAEVEALADLSKRGVSPKGSEVYVTLEPCAHEGKTGPCAVALVAAGVRRVVVAMGDPFAKVDGRGIAMLREAGIAVEVGLMEAEARRLNAPFLTRVGKGRPYVTAKWAQTVDGKIATATGESKWISGEAARRWVHRLRGRVDAVMVGIGTALADDPALTARGVRVKRRAMRVVVDPRLELAEGCKLLSEGRGGARGEGGGPVIVATAKERVGSRRGKALAARGVELVGLAAMKANPRRLALGPLMRHLAKRYDATNVLVEGGGGLIGSLLEQNLLDEAAVFVSPKLLGDAEGVAAVSGLETKRMRDAVGLKPIEVRKVGEDVLMRFEVRSEK